jgi:hypothetical protein
MRRGGDCGQAGGWGVMAGRVLPSPIRFVLSVANGTGRETLSRIAGGPSWLDSTCPICRELPPMRDRPSASPPAIVQAKGPSDCCPELCQWRQTFFHGMAGRSASLDRPRGGCQTNCHPSSNHTSAAAVPPGVLSPPPAANHSGPQGGSAKLPKPPTNKPSACRTDAPAGFGGVGGGP